jgi:hypothetical protein
VHMRHDLAGHTHASFLGKEVRLDPYHNPFSIVYDNLIPHYSFISKAALILFLKDVKQEMNDLQARPTYYTPCFPSSDYLLFDHFGDLYIDRMHTYNGNPQAFIQKHTKNLCFV